MSESLRNRVKVTRAHRYPIMNANTTAVRHIVTPIAEIAP
jgi:hypothetical protein